MNGAFVDVILNSSGAMITINLRSIHASQRKDAEQSFSSVDSFRFPTFSPLVERSYCIDQRRIVEQCHVSSHARMMSDGRSIYVSASHLVTMNTAEKNPMTFNQ